MSRKNSVDVVVIIFDVGKTVSDKNYGHGASFFDQSRTCISWILRRKIASMSKDLVALILTGTNEKSSYSDDECDALSENLCFKYDFAYISWDLLEYIEMKIKPTDMVSDWVGALETATEKIKLLEESYDLQNKTIVVFSDLQRTIPNGLSKILTNLKSLNIEVNFIGLELPVQSPQSNDLDEIPAKKARTEEVLELLKIGSADGKSLVNFLWHMAGDLVRICSFESAARQLFSYSQKKVRPQPWNCILDIGDIKIRIQLYRKMNPKNSIVPTLKCLKRNKSGPTKSSLIDMKRDKIMHYKHVDPTSNIIQDISVEDCDVIAGFRYGTSLIPFSEEDKFVMSYKPGPKCFTVLGFTGIDNIPHYILNGEGSYIVVARNDGEKSDVALSALIQALSETRTVAIVRRVYSDNRGLTLGALYPIIEEAAPNECDYKECLVFIELAFGDDLKTVRLPRMKRVGKKLTPEQLDAIDSLINEMDLMNVESGKKGRTYEELDLASRHDLKNQFFLHCLFHKALYPDEPLPEKLPKDCLQYTMPPGNLSLKAQNLTDKLLKLFPSKLVTSDSKSAPVDGQGMKSSVDSEEFYDFSSEKDRTAKNCFERLFQAELYPTAEAIRHLIDFAIGKFNFRQDDVVNAFVQATRLVRLRALEEFPDDYNYWLRRLRISLGTEGKVEHDYWKSILENNLGLISSEENKGSLTKKEDVEFFIESLTPKTEQSEMEKRRKADEEEEEAINLLF